VLPAVTTEKRYWSAVLAHLQPRVAWGRIVQTGDWPAEHPWTAGGAWLVYGAWALGAALVTVAAVRRRDQ